MRVGSANPARLTQDKSKFQQAFIVQHLGEASFKEIALTDRALHKHSFISNFVSVESLREHISNREKRKELATFYARQLELPGLQLP
jgi:hypothetical protein